MKAYEVTVTPFIIHSSTRSELSVTKQASYKTRRGQDRKFTKDEELSRGLLMVTFFCRHAVPDKKACVSSQNKDL
jgi:hypothetical protein